MLVSHLNLKLHPLRNIAETPRFQGSSDSRIHGTAETATFRCSPNSHKTTLSNQVFQEFLQSRI
jgi:uncharacterized cupin superfamily protein